MRVERVAGIFQISSPLGDIAFCVDGLADSGSYHTYHLESAGAAGCDAGVTIRVEIGRRRIRISIAINVNLHNIFFDDGISL